MRSLKAELILRLLIGAMLLLGLAGSVFLWRMKSALNTEFDDSLRLTAQSLQIFVEEEDHRLDMDSDVDDMRQFDREDGSSVFLLTDISGKEIRRSKSLAKQSLPAKGGSWDRPAIFETSLRDGRQLRCIGVFLDVEAHSPKKGETMADKRALLVVGRSNVPMEKTLGEVRNSLLAAGGLTLAALAVLLYWSVSKGLRPLDQLVADIAAVDGGSLGKRFQVIPLPTELRTIAVCLNELLERLGAAFDREKRFTANVAHELRTPLAELRVLAEMSMMVPAGTPQESVGRWQDIHAVIVRMESLALRLLELARSETPRNAIRNEPVRLVPLLESTWERLSLLGVGRRGITLDIRVHRDLEIQGDPVMMEIIVMNLMGNAAQYADPDSSFRIEEEDNKVRFLNLASHLEQADVSRLFERFWKKDASRTDGKHHGLGLSLAREASVLMGGDLVARLTSERCLEFTWNLAAIRG